VNTWKRGPTILIVDDDPRNVKLLEAILKTEGYFTLTAFNGMDARAVTHAEHPDLILLDIMMPGETGLDTCALLKKDPHVSDIPVIMVSALDDVSSKVKGLNMGAVDYITKPFEWLEVLARVRLHLKLRFAYKAIIQAQKAKLRQLYNAQQAILVRPSDLPEAKFYINYMPMMEAGGDFYDIFPVGEGIFGYFVADVSGHDLGASYLTSALKALISQNATPMNTPLETMKIMNSVLTGILRDNKYITACYAHLSRMQSRLTVVNAGHPPVIYVSAKGEIECLEGQGDILGAFEAVSFEPVIKKTAKGDRFFLYTDGFIEGFGEEKKSRKQGLKALMEACGSTLDLQIEKAVAEIAKHLSPPDSDVKDDLLLLGVEV